MLIQLTETCGHASIAAEDKCRLIQPAIEVYPQPIVYMGYGARMIKDLWQASQFTKPLIYTPK